MTETKSIEDLIHQLEDQRDRVAKLREQYGTLGSELNREDTKLRNLSNEFTRLMAGSGFLDWSTLEQTEAWRNRPKAHPVERAS